jgi:hypothetical protein
MCQKNYVPIIFLIDQADFLYIKYRLISIMKVALMYWLFRIVFPTFLFNYFN